MTFDYVLHDMSFTNIRLYSAVIPEYRSMMKDKRGKAERIVNADDPRNRDIYMRFVKAK